MADWSNPKLNSPYVNFLADLNAKIVESAQMYPIGTNIPVSSMRLERTQNIFQEWNGSAWGTRPIGVAGGGTGGSNGNDARVNLGFGTMCMQNANGVAITGGTISGVAIDAGYLTSGIIPDARFPEPLPARNGGNLYNLNAGALAFGQVPVARMGTGTANATTFLRGDGTWQVLAMSSIKSIQHISHSFVVLGNVSVPRDDFTVPLQAAVNPAKCFVIGRVGNSLSIYVNEGPGGAGFRHFSIAPTLLNLFYMRNTSGEQSTLNFNFTVVEYT